MMSDITYREATADDAASVARVHVLSWHKSFKGIVPDTFLEKLTIENRTEHFRKRFADSFYKMFVAETLDGQVVGFADGGKPRHDVPYDAELYAIYILHELQGKGIGARLFERVKDFLIAQRNTSMYLMALEASPYRPFYEKMGGRLVGKKQIKLEDVDFNAVIYGWEKLVE